MCKFPTNELNECLTGLSTDTQKMEYSQTHICGVFKDIV